MNEIVLIGVGEIGGVLARGILRIGYPVYPITRAIDPSQAAQKISDPQSVIVAVGEKDLPDVLRNIPSNWRDKLVLLQNELLPRDWQAQGILNPTVISIWFEKKAGQDYKVILPSPVYGRQSPLIKNALESINIPCDILPNEEKLLFELVLKNLYILTTNIAGLQVGGTIGELWRNHQDLARTIANEVMDIQFWLIKKSLNREQLIQGMRKAFEKDLSHKCMGRTASVRLERAIRFADEAGLAALKLREIALIKK